MATGRLQASIDSDLKPIYKARCARNGTKMLPQAELLIKSWLTSTRQDLTNQARAIVSTDRPRSGLDFDIDEDLKNRFAEKCAIETVSMSAMLETLIVDWIDFN
jgi:hypothetical protein